MAHGPGIKSSQQNNLNTGTWLNVNSDVSWRMKKKKIYQDYSKITKATKGNKNIILIAGAIILVGLLYYMISPY